MRAADVRQWLIEEREKVAHDALSSPVGRDAFAYGMACGMYGGLSRALILFDELLEERERVRLDL